MWTFCLGSSILQASYYSDFGGSSTTGYFAGCADVHGLICCPIQLEIYVPPDLVRGYLLCKLRLLSSRPIPSSLVNTSRSSCDELFGPTTNDRASGTSLTAGCLNVARRNEAVSPKCHNSSTLVQSNSGLRFSCRKLLETAL